MTYTVRGQVEQHLGRELTDAELQEVGSIDELTDDQIAVLAEIRPRNRIAPMIYVKAIVPTAEHDAVMKLIDEDLERIVNERRPPEELPNENMFEHHAGRPLRAPERVRVESFEKMSPQQIELARTLARADLATGFLYLSRIVPGESTERRHELAKHLAEG
jgi:hypothetical protein